MSRICLRTRITPPRIAQACGSGIARCLHTTPQIKSAAVLTPPSSLLPLNPLAARRKQRDLVRWKKLQDLKRNLETDGFSRGRVWSSYVDLLSFLRPDEIPLEIHRQVLRKCTTSLAQARYDIVARMQEKQRIRAVHPHEARFQAIIYNMRQGGYKPSASDYHFVLRHFAAVGQHVGSLQVLQEMSQMGVEKGTKTYELCLQALYRRLTLPTWHGDRPKLASGISSMVFKLLKEMEQSKVPLTSTNVDLCFSIIGEALEDEPFERLMKLAYGIDLAYPDRPPLEFWDKKLSSTKSEDSSLSPLHPFPFTTSALNNTVEFLGRKGRIAKLVQAFEVLTTPLPTGVSTSRDSSYLDDADDDFGDDHPEVAPFTPPHAAPNTLTYERLIKWISRDNHAVFARHYLYQAYRCDRENEKALRVALSQEDVDHRQVQVPNLMFTAKMLLSVYGLTNREKKLPMMRWTLHMLYRVKRRRRADIAFFRRLVERLEEGATAQRRADKEALAVIASTWGTPELELELPTEDVVESIQVSSSLSISHSDSGTSRVSEAEVQSSSATETSDEKTSEDVSENDETVTSSPSQRPRVKGFSPNLHLNLLRREYSRLLILERRMTDVTGRTTQRIKERLGRRVWASKDIYLRSQAARVLITKEQWRTSVNYRPRRPKVQADPEDVALGLPNPRQPFIRGVKMDYFTSSTPRPRQKPEGSGIQDD